MDSRLKTLLLSTLAFGTVGSLSGTIVFSDDFSDGNRTANPAWYITPGAASGTFAVNGSALELFGVGGSNQYISAMWSGSTFANVGDTLTLSVTFKYADPGSSIDGRDQEMVFGVGNNNGTALTADNMGTATDDFGYFMAIGGSGSGSNGTAISRDAGGDRWLGSNSDVTDLTVSNTGPFAAETYKTFTMVITQTGSGYDLSLGDGITTINGSDASPVATTFNMVTMGWYGRSTTNVLSIDSVSVDFAPIPEPSAFASLLGASALGLLVYHRRRTLRK